MQAALGAGHLGKSAFFDFYRPRFLVLLGGSVIGNQGFFRIYRPIPARILGGKFQKMLFSLSVYRPIWLVVAWVTYANQFFLRTHSPMESGMFLNRTGGKIV